ncbi:endonuclease domain-containing protein [Microbacterium sp. HD4P20]|uniref:endonuclease domain-containing protein n=1 Tax=Microbacterium sp. HD4P20 TaxID=2864874 RepID=UPI001C63EC06|nr:type IV toxin-antitoxin system AbiEi family antitoxin domain-containing protein [Microbacterium sp. HD4P20]MCP2637613.1 endonuclease domain-containing protein [Microbacterium sp. HD4P20]
MQQLVHVVKKLGGVVRSASLVDAGFSRLGIAAAVESGELMVPRRGWVAATDADPNLVAAARAGVVLTCVTRAKRLGLWVLEEPCPHVGAPSTASRLVLPDARVHWNAPVAPRAPGQLEDGILNTLVLVASCQPYEPALAAWESALKSGLVNKEELRRLPLRPRARRLLEDASPFSDSGLETFVIVRLKWLRLPIRAQIWIGGHRVDFLIGDRLVLQVDGGHHVGLQRAEDVAHDAALTLLGYHVIRVTYVQVVERWHEVQDLVQRAVAQGLHTADPLAPVRAGRNRPA